MSESWARISLSIDGPSHRVATLSDLLGRANESHHGGRWAIDVTRDSESPLDSQLAALRGFLEAHEAVLRAVSEWGEVSVLLSWTPRSPQDGLVIEPTLIRLMADLNAYVRLDTYTDD